MTDLPFDDDLRNPFMEGDDLPKPEQDDYLILRQMEINEGVPSNLVRVLEVHDSLAESWDPVGEAAWQQHDTNDAAGFKGHWYAIVCGVVDPLDGDWSVGSYEVEKIVPKADEMQKNMLHFRALSESLRTSVTPEFLATISGLQAAWLLEHLEMLRDESLKLKEKIENHLAERQQQ